MDSGIEKGSEAGISLPVCQYDDDKLCLQNTVRLTIDISRKSAKAPLQTFEHGA